MKLIANVSLCSFLLCTLAMVGVVEAQKESAESTGVLVSPKWLENEMKTNENLVVIDLPFRKTNYKVGHIPGSVMLDWRSDIINAKRTDLYRLPEKEAMETLMSGIGATNESLIVVTDDMANRAAVRMYYTLKFFGHEEVRILNGGTRAWKAAGKKLTDKVEDVQKSKYQVKQTKDDFFVRLEAVEKAIDNEWQLIDGRPAEQFSGEKPGKVFHTNKPHKRLGHIPTAKNIPWKANLNQDGTFKPIDELRELYESNGIDVDGSVVTYCNEGLHAAMPWFIFRELFGSKDIRLYDDSMAEWANLDETPMDKAGKDKEEGEGK